MNLTKSDLTLDHVGHELVESLDRVISSLPLRSARPQDFARQFGVNKDIASRLFSAIRSKDPLAAVHRLPGSTALRSVLAAAEAHGADPALVRRAEESVRAFDAFVRDEFDDRAGMDALIGASLPGARRKFEATSKQTMYRGAVGLKGVTSDAILVTFIAYPTPGAEKKTCNTAVVNGFVGLRRVRPGAVIQLASVVTEPGHTSATLEGGPVESPGSPLLNAFCSPPSPPVLARREGKHVHYTLRDVGVGPKSAVDLFLAELVVGNHPRYRDPAKPGKRWFYSGVDHPTKLLIFDLLLRRDMWPRSEPELRLYDSIIYGLADPNDPRRDKDRLDLAETIAPLGIGTDRFRCEEVPNYPGLLAEMFNRLGQNGDDFRGYRARVAYPFYGSQVCMLFDPPDPIGKGGDA
jgi:hypothetical protein